MIKNELTISSFGVPDLHPAVGPIGLRTCGGEDVVGGAVAGPGPGYAVLLVVAVDDVVVADHGRFRALGYRLAAWKGEKTLRPGVSVIKRFMLVSYECL